MSQQAYFCKSWIWISGREASANLTSRLVWITTSRLYTRYQEDADMRDGSPLESYYPMTVRVTGKPVQASNVIVMMAAHTFANPYDKDDEVFQIDLFGMGEAYVFRDGVGIPARWIRTNRDQPLLFTTLGGEVSQCDRVSRSTR